MKAGKSVNVGQRFRTTKSLATVWEVEYVYSDPNAIPHVRLFNVSVPCDKRTIAITTLLNRDAYVSQ